MNFVFQIEKLIRRTKILYRVFFLPSQQESIAAARVSTWKIMLTSSQMQTRNMTWNSGGGQKLGRRKKNQFQRFIINSQLARLLLWLLSMWRRESCAVWLESAVSEKLCGRKTKHSQRDFDFLFHSGEKSKEKFRGNEKFSADFVVLSARESRRVLPYKTAFP